MPIRGIHLQALLILEMVLSVKGFKIATALD